MNSKYVAYTLLATCLLFGSLGNISSSADEPANQGRPITPAGSLVQDVTTRQTAVGALPVDLVRSPDKLGPGGEGRFLISVNSGYGIQFNAAGNRGQQSLSVIDLNAKLPAVVQNVYFPSPQSVNFGIAFAPVPQDDGSYALYVSGGFENKIWIFRFQAEHQTPVTPASPGPNTNVEAPFIDVSGFASAANSPRYNSDREPVYPTGIAITPDGNTLFVANNLGDSLGVIEDVRGRRKLTRVDLRREGDGEQFIYPYAVVVVPQQGSIVKAYVSCWNDSTVAVVQAGKLVSRVVVGRHPTKMLLNAERTRLYVANSNGDSVSVIDTQTDKEIERINVRLSEGVPPGNSPEGLALRGDDLYVANAHSNSVAVVELNNRPSWENRATRNRTSQEEGLAPTRSRVKGFIPTGQYPSALALAGPTLFIGNGKGTGVQNSSLIVDNSGRVPNMPNERFPSGSGRAGGQGGQYSVALVVGNISAVNLPDDPALARYTQQVMRNNGLLGERQTSLFTGRSPIKHVIYIIKENRTYDQIFGDVEKSGDGTKADGDASLAIFGAGSAAARPNGQRQDITPNHRALALRFGLFDRFL